MQVRKTIGLMRTHHWPYGPHTAYCIECIYTVRIELESCGWAQIEGHWMLILYLSQFFNYCIRSAKINATDFFSLCQFWQTFSRQFLWKSLIFSKSNNRRALGPTFLDSSHNFWSISPFFEWKKKIFRFFSNFSYFYPFSTTTYKGIENRGVALMSRIAPIILKSSR